MSATLNLTVHLVRSRESTVTFRSVGIWNSFGKKSSSIFIWRPRETKFATSICVSLSIIVCRAWKLPTFSVTSFWRITGVKVVYSTACSIWSASLEVIRRRVFALICWIFSCWIAESGMKPSSESSGSREDTGEYKRTSVPRNNRGEPLMTRSKFLNLGDLLLKRYFQLKNSEFF